MVNEQEQGPVDVPASQVPDPEMTDEERADLDRFGVTFTRGPDGQLAGPSSDPDNPSDPPDQPDPKEQPEYDEAEADTDAEPDPAIQEGASP